VKWSLYKHNQGPSGPFLLSKLLQLLFGNEGVDEFFDNIFIILTELFYRFKLLEKFRIFKGGLRFLIFTPLIKKSLEVPRASASLFRMLAGGCTP